MYANYSNMNFDSTKQYAFLRSGKDEFLIVVANFDSKPVDISVHIPFHAFEYMEIKPHEIKKAKELLSKKNFTLSPQWDRNLFLNIEEYSGKIIKFSMS